MTRPPPRSTLFPYTTLFRSTVSLTVILVVMTLSTQHLLHAQPAELRTVTIRVAPDETYRRSEEHTSELQSRGHLVCRLPLEKKNNTIMYLGAIRAILILPTT